MRILIIPEWYPWPDQPGYGIFCREQAHVVSRLHDVVVLAGRVGESVRYPFATSDQQEDGIRTLRVQYRAGRVPKLTGAHMLLGVASVLRRLVRREGWLPDVIHAHEYLAGPLAFRIGRLTGAPVVVSEHASAFALDRVRPRHLTLARQVFGRAEVISTPSHDLARRLAHLTARTPIVPVANAVDTSLFRPGRVVGAPPIRLVTVGNLVEIKGHRHLLDALPPLVRSGLDIQLDVVGNGNQLQELRDQANRVGVGDRVVFRGALDRRGVAKIMRDAHIFVLPSMWDNMPCALIEAMASGLPAVASCVGGVPEIIDHETGVLTEAGSVESLRTGLEQAVRERQRFRVDLLRERATARFGHVAIGRQWNDVYQLAVSHSSRDGERSRTFR